MIKLLLLLIPFSCFGQTYTIDRISYDPGGANDTLWTRDGSNKDTLFRRVAGVFQFGNKPYFRKMWTTADLPDWDSHLDVINSSIATKLSSNGSAANLTSFPTFPQSQITNLVSDLAAKAPINNPQFTGTATGIGFPVYARVTGSNATTTGQALVDITGLSVALVANATYELEVMLSCQTTAVTTGTGYGIQYSAAGATIEGWVSGSSTTTAHKTLRVSAFNTSAQAYLTTSGQTGGISINATVTVGANAGTLSVRHLKVTSGTSTVFIGSKIKVTRIL